jgi:hypothetical protein
MPVAPAVSRCCGACAGASGTDRRPTTGVPKRIAFGVGAGEEIARVLTRGTPIHLSFCGTPVVLRGVGVVVGDDALAVDAGRNLAALLHGGSCRLRSVS